MPIDLTAQPMMTAQWHEWSVEVYPQLTMNGKYPPFYATCRRIGSRGVIDGFNVEADTPEEALRLGIEQSQRRGNA